MRHPSRSNPANRVSDPWPSRRIWLRRALVTYVIGLLLAVTLPIGHLIDISLIRLYQLGRLVGVPNGVSPAWYEFLLNVALFAVPTAMAAVLWPAVRPWIGRLPRAAAPSRSRLSSIWCCHASPTRGMSSQTPSALRWASVQSDSATAATGNRSAAKAHAETRLVLWDDVHRDR